MRYLSVIPARGGSKGLPGKNIKNLCSKPLIAWSIEQSLACRHISDTVVSTDCEDIAEIARRFGANVPFLRPMHLAQDETPTEPVILHALEWFTNRGVNFDAVIILQPTSPVRHHDSIERAIYTFEKTQSNSLLSVTENHHFFWKGLENPVATYDFRNRPRRQDIKSDERLYRENGSIYITKVDSFISGKNRLCEPISMFLMTEEESWEIDSLTDFMITEKLMDQSNL